MFRPVLILAALLAAGGAAAPGQPAPDLKELKGVWGAIAYSPADGRYGFTWGAARSEHARHDALRHCEHQLGQACEVVTVFRNHRGRNEDDDSGFPYRRCAALARDETKPAAWGVAAAERRAAAEHEALGICKDKGGECRIAEWVCT